MMDEPDLSTDAELPQGFPEPPEDQFAGGADQHLSYVPIMHGTAHDAAAYHAAIFGSRPVAPADGMVMASSLPFHLYLEAVKALGFGPSGRAAGPLVSSVAGSERSFSQSPFAQVE